MIAVDPDFESFLPGVSPVTEAEFVVFGEGVVGEDWVSAGLAPADAGNEVVDVALVAVAFEADMLDAPATALLGRKGEYWWAHGCK